LREKRETKREWGRLADEGGCAATTATERTVYYCEGKWIIVEDSGEIVVGIVHIDEEVLPIHRSSTSTISGA